MISVKNPMSWEELATYTDAEVDRINGPTNAYSTLRLFNKHKSELQVTLYRDHHAWCPYCQKIWLWLEFKKIPYRIKKVTMRCYGDKESWYLSKVPSGLLPALEVNDKVITESDQILFVLEKLYGPLGRSLEHPQITKLRKLERELFRAWCEWLCYRSVSETQEQRKKERFQNIAKNFENQIEESKSSWIDASKSRFSSIPGVGDIIFIPYIERMNASLAYYKGFSLREEHPMINKWLKNLEELDEYRGTQGDFHTHAHDLPPQMGNCFLNPNIKQKELARKIDEGYGLGSLELYLPQSTELFQRKMKTIALTRVVKHRENIIATNIMGDKHFDQPLRAALTNMVANYRCHPEKGSAYGLRYLRDRISVPRDMPLIPARHLRQTIELTAQLDGETQGPKIPIRNRFDQNPIPFIYSKTLS